MVTFLCKCFRKYIFLEVVFGMKLLEALKLRLH